MSEKDLLSDLKRLRNKWKDDYERYIDSDIESERILSTQQYVDCRELEELIEKHDPGYSDDE